MIILTIMTDTDLAEFDQIHSAVQRLREQIHRLVIGQDVAVEHLTAAMLVGGHVLLIGVPGLAKTMLVRATAGALGWRFSRIQFTPDLMPSDVIGTDLIQENAATGHRELRFAPGPVFTNLLLADEINRTPPRTQAALLEAMAERQVTAGGRTMMLDEPFVVVATQNPIEQEGTYPLPEAQLDRFMFSIQMAYPPEQDERRIVSEVEPDGRAAMKAEPVLRADEAVRMGRLIRRMPVSEHVRDYAVRLVRASRPDDASATALARRCVGWGAGPRAGQYLALGARALAAMEGLPTPSCEHMRRIAPAVLCHRIVTNYTAAGEGVSAADVVRELLEKIGE